jgi:uncharacterized protein involved in exopolysaccharide biosynthesis
MIAHPPTPKVQGPSTGEYGLAAYHELWHIIRRRKGRILVLAVLGLVAGAQYCAVSGPWYDSSAQLLVHKKTLQTTPITGPDQARGHEDYLATHMLLISSRRVIGRAIEKGDLQSLAQFQDHGGLRSEISDWIGRELLGSDPEERRKEKLVTDLINALVVTRDAQKPGVSPSNEVINLSLRGKVAADCPKILEAIIDSYQEFLTDTYRNTNAEAVELIAQARSMVHKDLETKEAAYQKFLKETPPLWKTQDRSTAHQDHLLKVDAKLSALRMRRAELEASVAVLEKAAQQGRNATATVLRMSAAPTNGGTAGANPVTGQTPQRPIVSFEDELVGLQLQRAKLLSVYPRTHPEVLAVNRQIDAVRRMILPTAGRPNEPLDANGGDVDLGAIKIELLRQELDELKANELALTRLFDAEQKDVSESYIHEIQDEAHRKGIERDRKMYDEILTRLKETSSVKDFGSYDTQVIGPALRGAPAVKKYAMILGLSLFGGLFAGFAWSSLLEIAGKRSQAAV